MNQAIPQTQPVPQRQSLWQSVLKSVGFILLFEGCQLVLGYVVQIACILQAGGFGRFTTGSEMVRYLEETYYPVLYEVMFLAAGLFLLITALIYLFRPRSFTACAGLVPVPLGHLIAAILLGFGAFFLVSWLMEALQLLPVVQKSAEDYDKTYQVIEKAIEKNGRPWVDILYSIVGAPVAEEVLCRGLVLRQFRRSTTDWTAIVASALVFAFIHGNVYQFVFTLPLGILLGYVAVRSNSVIPAILIHAAFNGSNYLLLLWQYMGLDEDSVAATLVSYLVQLFFVLAGAAGGWLLWRIVRAKPRLTHPFTPKPPVVQPASPDAPDAPAETQPFDAFSDDLEGDVMPAPEFLVVGLGNPGEKYASTRHNAGFIAMDYIAIREGLAFDRIRFRAMTADKEIDGHRVLFLKPQTFMNLSGESVREAAAFYHIPPEKILVLVDDVCFEPGVMRIRASGSAGGHNGLKNIIECLGTETFPRVRLGVGALPPGRDLVGWVLSGMPEDDMDKLISTLENVRATVRFFLDGELEGAMSEFNGKAN